MSVNFYMDVHINRAITTGLRTRGVDVLTAQEDGNATLADPALLDRATSLNRVLFSQDVDFLVEGRRRQQAGERFAGIVYAHQEKLTIGQTVDELELLSKSIRTS